MSPTINKKRLHILLVIGLLGCPLFYFFWPEPSSLVRQHVLAVIVVFIALPLISLFAPLCSKRYYIFSFLVILFAVAYNLFFQIFFHNFFK